MTNTSLKNVNAGLSPNECMDEGPNSLASLLEVIIGFRMCEVALTYDMTKAYQSIIEKDKTILNSWGSRIFHFELKASLS